MYDDSCPVENTPFGWQWDSEGNAVIDETIDCNPAKGTLMVRSTGEPVNLFFSYGKAVMTEHGSAAEDTGIDEIGIGYLEVDFSIIQPIDMGLFIGLDLVTLMLIRICFL